MKEKKSKSKLQAGSSKNSARITEQVIPPAQTDQWGDDVKESPKGVFTVGELGAPDQERLPGSAHARDFQGGTGPLNQSGEGNRQNDQLAELEEVEPDIDLDKTDR